MDAEEEKKFIQEVKNALLHSSIHLQYHLIQGFGLYTYISSP